jgi:3-oxoacyl-[acyl-carrier protein] reductase
VDFELRGRSFVVGGASRGIGRAVAEELVEQGARVLLVSRGGGTLKSTASSLGCPYVEAPMDDPATPERVRSAVDSELGGSFDGLLVNAGGPPPGAALSLTDEQWRGAFELLLAGPIRLLRELAPAISEGGAIAWVLSSSVRQPIPGLDASNAFRPGLAALVKVLARELGPRVRVNGVAPGRIETDRVRELDELRAARTGESLEEARGAAAAAIPLGRSGEPAEIGRAIAFLLSPAASYVSGLTLQVDGGSIAALP